MLAVVPRYVVSMFRYNTAHNIIHNYALLCIKNNTIIGNNNRIVFFLGHRIEMHSSMICVCDMIYILDRRTFWYETEYHQLLPYKND